MGIGRPFVVLAWVTAAAAAGCGFDTRSGQYECDFDRDCSGDRTCQDGWCVREGGGGDGDGAIDAGDSGGPIQCPAGEPCEVVCSETGDCTYGVDCSDSTSCDVTCSGMDSCAGGVVCGPGPCTVNCGGIGSCEGPIHCSASCSCEVNCGSGACGSVIDCPFGGQCQSGGVCHDEPVAACDMC